MILAYSGEGKAAPFGVYIDSSAIDNGNGRGFSASWKWHMSKTLKIKENIQQDLCEAVLGYFDATSEYPKLDEHKRCAKEYLMCCESC